MAGAVFGLGRCLAQCGLKTAPLRPKNPRPRPAATPDIPTAQPNTQPAEQPNTQPPPTACSFTNLHPQVTLQGLQALVKAALVAFVLKFVQVDIALVTGGQVNNPGGNLDGVIRVALVEAAQ